MKGEDPPQSAQKPLLNGTSVCVWFSMFCVASYILLSLEIPSLKGPALHFSPVPLWYVCVTFFFRFVLVLCMCMFACVYVHHVCTWSLWRSEENNRYPETAVRDSSELPSLESSLGPLEKQ